MGPTAGSRIGEVRGSDVNLGIGTLLIATPGRAAVVHPVLIAQGGSLSKWTDAFSPRGKVVLL